MSDPTYFAQINDKNIVLDVRVVNAEYMTENPELYTGTWIETYLNVAGKTYAGLGYIYDYATDNFYVPEPVIEP